MPYGTGSRTYCACIAKVAFLSIFQFFLQFTRLTAKKNYTPLPQKKIIQFFFIIYTTYRKKKITRIYRKKKLHDDFFVHDLHFSRASFASHSASVEWPTNACMPNHARRKTAWSGCQRRKPAPGGPPLDCHRWLRPPRGGRTGGPELDDGGEDVGGGEDAEREAQWVQRGCECWALGLPSGWVAGGDQAGRCRYAKGVGAPGDAEVSAQQVEGRAVAEERGAGAQEVGGEVEECSAGPGCEAEGVAVGVVEDALAGGQGGGREEHP